MFSFVKATKLKSQSAFEVSNCSIIYYYHFIDLFIHLLFILFIIIFSIFMKITLNYRKKV